MEFAEAHQASVRQRHRLVPIATHELPDGSQLTFNRKRNIDDTALDQREQRIDVAAVPPQKMRRLRKHRLTSQERRLECRHHFASPAMMQRRTNQKSDERTSVRNDSLLHSPKSSRYFGLVAISDGPSRQPARSLAIPRQDVDCPFGAAFNNVSTHSRTTADLEVRRRLASSDKRESSDSGSFKDMVGMPGK